MSKNLKKLREIATDAYLKNEISSLTFRLIRKELRKY